MPEFAMPAPEEVAVEDSPAALALDVEAIARIGSVPSILRLVCEISGMGFAAVARVTDGTWTACAVRDGIGFGLPIGGQLELRTTLCHEARLGGKTIAFDQASVNEKFRDHHTPRLYQIESYFSTPIVLKDGTYFGNLCAIDRKPARVEDARTLEQLELFAELIAAQLQSDERYRESETARQRESASAELREHFIAVLGHDLRNPLSALSASAQLVQRVATDPKTLRATEVMRSSIRRMSALIEDVMDLARSRLGGGIGARIAPVANLVAPLREVCDEIAAAHPDARVVEALVIGCPVDCDAGRLQQLLSNLLGNAIAHGDKALPIEAAASIDDGWLRLSVSNFGATIPPEVLSRVFEPFWRPASSVPGGGLGLGLYICQQIAMAHGGSMSASSSGGATRFEALLPVRA